MDSAELTAFCAARGWKTEVLPTNSTPGVRIVFLCGASAIVSFSGRNGGCRLKIPLAWLGELRNQYYFNSTSRGEILWKCSELTGFLEFAEKMDQAAYESRSTDCGNRVTYRRRCEAEKGWIDYKRHLSALTTTERVAEITGRVGQTMLRDLLLARFGACVITGISEPDLLVASHIKPWSECADTPEERLNENNVLLLSVALDKLFDAHYISFDCHDGKMLVSPLISWKTLNKLGVFPERMSLKILNDEQARFLEYHNRHLR